MKKKLGIIIAVIVVGVLLFAGYKAFLSPKGVKGAKEVKIQIVIKDQNVDKTFTYDTDHEFLLDLVKEKQGELGASFQEFDFGTMVTGLMNYTVDAAKNEYFHILVNDADAAAGISETPLKDGDVYRFELRKY